MVYVDTGKELAELRRRIDYLERNAEVPSRIGWSNVDHPDTFPPDPHTEPWDSITGKPSTYPPSAHSEPWGSITGKPALYPPDLPARLETAADNVSNQDLNGILDTGWYRGTNVGNAPNSSWWYFQVIAHDNRGYVAQVAYRYFTPYDQWQRVRDNGAWKPWRQVQFTDDSLSASRLTGTIDRARVPFQMASGSFGGKSVGAGASTSTTVTFPGGRFTAAPTVVATLLADMRDITTNVDAASTTSVVIRLGSVSTITRSGLGVNWLAYNE